MDTFGMTDFHKKIKYPFALLILLMVAGVYLFVNATGGIKYVFSHSMYLPIVLAAIIFWCKRGAADWNTRRSGFRSIHADRHRHG